MANTIITADDVLLFAPELGVDRASALVADVLAVAISRVPSLAVLDADKLPAARAVLRRAVLRLHAEGSGAVVSTSRTAGVYGFTESVDTRSRRRDGVLTDAEDR